MAATPQSFEDEFRYVIPFIIICCFKEGRAFPGLD